MTNRGASLRFPPTCRIAGRRSPGRWTARWSSTRSTAARKFSWPTSRTPLRRLGKISSKARRTSATPCAARFRSAIPTASNTSSMRKPPRCSCVRAAGICRRSTSSWTASRFPAACLISVCISFTTPPNCSSATAARIFICRRWRAISKRGSGTTFSISRRTR